MGFLNIFKNKSNSMGLKWSVFDAVLVLILLFGVLVSVKAFAPQISDYVSGLQFFGLDIELKLFFFSALLQTVAILTIVGIVFRFRGAGFKDIGLTTKNFIQNLYIGIGGGFVLFFLVVFLGAVIMALTKYVPPPQEVATYLIKMEGTWGRLLALFIGAVMAPLSEELYFRGMVYPAIKKKWGRIPGIIVSGMFFSLMHFDLIRFIPIAVGGMGLAYLYDRTESLWTSIFAHATWNGIMMVIMVLSAPYISY